MHAISCCLLAGVLLFLSGCSGSRNAIDRSEAMPAGYPNHSYAEIINNLTAMPYTVEGYSSEAALVIKSPVQGGSFSASIKHIKDDSLLISISPGLGIVAVRALVTKDSFFVHDRINKELGIGTINAMQRLLPLPADARSLYGAMLGVWLPETGPDWELSSGDSYYILKDDTRTLFIDPVFWRVVRYVENNEAGTLVEERTFSEFKDYDGFFLPRRLTFRRPGDDTSASLFHRKRTINPTSLSLDFNVSSSVKRVEF
ncbi:MAG: DUF4292 domain-containing protein [Bacteroidota bacterium]